MSWKDEGVILFAFVYAMSVSSFAYKVGHVLNVEYVVWRCTLYV